MSDTRKPNIVMMVADNTGYGDLGCYGGGELRGAPTPNDARSEGGLIPVRPELLLSLSTGRPFQSGGRHVRLPYRLSMRAQRRPPDVISHKKTA